MSPVFLANNLFETILNELELICLHVDKSNQKLFLINYFIQL